VDPQFWLKFGSHMWKDIGNPEHGLKKRTLLDQPWRFSGLHYFASLADFVMMSAG